MSQNISFHFNHSTYNKLNFTSNLNHVKTTRRKIKYIRFLNEINYVLLHQIYIKPFKNENIIISVGLF